MNPEIRYTVLDSPIGNLLLTASRKGLSGLWVVGEKHCPDLSPQWLEDSAFFAGPARQIAEYFSGSRSSFDLELDATGTAFQMAAWGALQHIPHGSTRTYQQQAAAIGCPASIRAVGTANGKNPICIIVPCHRVIGANGSLTGYGGGLRAKQWLLSHEAGHLPPELQPTRL